MAIAPEIVETLRAKFDALLPHLDQRAQPLMLAAEARSLGHGGIAAVACASGASRSRVQQGVAELERGEEPTGRVRRPGAGRKHRQVRLAEALVSAQPTRRGRCCSGPI